MGPQERRNVLARVEVIFLPKKGKNILSSELFHDIRDIEMLIQKFPGYADYCLGDIVKDRVHCFPPNSLMTYFFPTKRANGDIIFDGRGPDMGLFDFTLAEALNQDSSYFYFSDDLDVRQKSAVFLKSVFIFSSTLGARADSISAVHSGRGRSNIFTWRPGRWPFATG